MKNSQKGITLIALIITIIVLLILAVVAIGAVQNDGIINHAKNAREEYGKAGVNENITLQEYLSKIEANLPRSTGTGSEGEKNTVKNCEKCKDGYIIGYVCPEYGKGCNAVSTECNIGTYEIKCDKCGYSDHDYFPTEKPCDRGDGIMRWTGKVGYATLNNCSHSISGTLPTAGSYPCPDCSK